jgi:hypothetical protein
MELLTRDECKKIIIKLSREFCVPPGRILSHLIDDSDKIDMMAGKLSIDELRCHIGAWMGNGMPDLVGRSVSMTENKTPVNHGIVYRKPFVSHIEVTRGQD